MRLSAFLADNSSTARVTRRRYNTPGASIWLNAIKGPGQDVPLIRNEYDAAGRLAKHTDADGNVILHDHRIGKRQEVVTDRNGNRAW